VAIDLEAPSSVAGVHGACLIVTASADPSRRPVAARRYVLSDTTVRAFSRAASLGAPAADAPTGTVSGTEDTDEGVSMVSS